MDTVKLINDLADKEIFIYILPDLYLLGLPVSWTARLVFKDKGEWVDIDCGMYEKWEAAFQSCLETILDNNLN
jgi:hypothetical protein